MRGINGGVREIVSRLTSAVDSIPHDLENLTEIELEEIQASMEDAITTIEGMYADMEDVLSDWR
jgi:hypothetical protein